MKNKVIKTIIFILYSWFIYSLCIIICAPLIIYQDGFSYYIELFVNVFLCIPFIAGLFLNPLYIFPLLGVLAFASIFNSIQVVLWWQKQTLARAWLLSFSGLTLGPGAIFVMKCFIGGITRTRLAMLIAVCMFYSGLYCLACIQKERWPDSKIAHKIRFILAWPCLRT